VVHGLRRHNIEVYVSWAVVDDIRRNIFDAYQSQDACINKM
jgi:hypothetical protein